MRLSNRLLVIAALFVLAIPLIFTGTASARYMDDGAAPATAGGFVTPNDMVCIVGVHADGTLDIADGVTNARDCIYLQTGTMNGGTPFDLTGMTNQNDCTKVGSGTNDGAKHSWATSFCTKSLAGLDRTQQMCEGIGGTWITSGKCVAYTRQFRGQDATGTPLTFGAKGTTSAQGAGYCYAKMRFTKETNPNYTSTTCPSYQATTAPFNANAAYDWDWNTTSGNSACGANECCYAKGIAGVLSSALTKYDGSTYAAGTYIDLSAYTTMGDCLANGGSWNNWTNWSGQPDSISDVIGTDTNHYKRPVWDYTKRAPDADNGCLHCHSTLTQYNGPAERWKDSYLKTGHKNMLRKVIPGNLLTGPDGVAYTTDGTNAINFMTSSDSYGKITVGGVDQNLYYIYGDWMAVLPSVIYGTNGYGSAPGATNGYSCYACHTTGASDNSNPGVMAIGTPGYKGVQPQASFPGININAADPKWDVDGITCGRCHNAAVGPVNQTMINASSFPTTHTTSGGMGTIPGGPSAMSAYSTWLCFGCHQSIAKLWPAQGGSSSGTTQYDPTLIPAGVNHGASAGRDFNGHVLGNSFLNSVHGRYAGAQSGNGSITLNSLGKFDLTDTGGTSEYDSEFQGYTCWQSSSSSSPAKTKADGSEIKDKATCEGLYGAGAWRSDNQGSCTTCHDVHNSLFVEDQAEKAMRKECADCHVNNATTGATVADAPQVVLANMNHPGKDGVHNVAGTPFDTTLYGSDPCAVCHMATQAERNGDQNSMPIHLWRISTDANYNTFPTADQFNGTNGATKDRNAQVADDDGYANAVWVDLDLACGQCHGGSLGTGATHNNAPYMNKAALATYAAGIHNGVSNQTPTPPTPNISGGTVLVDANWTATATDTSTPGSAPIKSVLMSWGDGSSSTQAGGTLFTHNYLKAGSYTVVQTVTGTDGGQASAQYPVTVASPIIMGHVYRSNTTTAVAGALVYVTRTANNKTNSYVTATKTDGSFSYFNIGPGTYTQLKATKSGYTFPAPTNTIDTNGGNNIINAVTP